MTEEGERGAMGPRRMIHKAQAEVSENIYQLHIARAMGNDDRLEAAAKKLHAATLLYHRQISRYRDHEAIADLWRQDIAGGSDMQLSLQSVSEFRMRNEADTTTRFDADRNKQVRQQVERAWTMDAELALLVNDQLDRCAEALGFAAAPEEDDQGVVAEVV